MRTEPSPPATLVRLLLLAAFLGAGGPRPRLDPTAGAGAGLGVHFAIAQAAAARLATANAQEVLSYVTELEDRAECGARDGCSVATDGQWLVLHRCVTAGQAGRPGRSGGPPGPLAYAFLGTRRLAAPADFFAASLLAPAEAARTAQSLAGVGRGWLRSRFRLLGAGDNTAFDHAWEAFGDLRAFFARAASASRAVLFTATG
ncbi:DUF1877 family protein [Streptomyces sp. NPDC020412]|uniref:DUF1877 family protein n=1 Tax=Streptomyces sp. NPDC020412 TaxID=3365073 RepID=UPI00379A92F5